MQINIVYDPDAENPRNWDNLGTLAIRNHFGDEEPTTPPKDSFWLPVYRYEHGCTLFNTTGFHCPWDSAQTGYIYVLDSKVREEFGVKRISPKLRARVIEILKSEVAVYSAWANGEVYGFEIPELGESCYGFYDRDEAIEEAKSWLT